MSWLQRFRHLVRLGIVMACVLISIEVGAQVLKRLESDKPRPTMENLRYGPFERNVLDFWKAQPRGDSTGLTPLVVFFHGGGFIGGDKKSVPGWLVDRCLAKGISVASVNYRYSTQSPYPAPMMDGANAIQFLRSRSTELGFDPKRVGGCGNSAGAGIALWNAFRDDLANPGSPVRVLRQSSRLRCVGVVGAQTSYDPRFIKKLIGGRAHEHMAFRPLFGISTDLEAESPRIQRLFEESSPINHVSPGDPPVLMFYSEPDASLPANARPGQGIHHPRFGRAFKAALDPLGIECTLRHHDDYRSEEEPEEAMYAELVEFFDRHLRTPRP